MHHLHLALGPVPAHDRLLLDPNLKRRAGGILDVVLPAFSEHGNLHCRTHYFDILRDAWQMHAELRLRLRPPLLALLGDPDPALRARVLKLPWTDPVMQQPCHIV